MGQGQPYCPKDINHKKMFGSYRVNKSLRSAAAYEPVQKHKTTHGDTTLTVINDEMKTTVISDEIT